MNHPKLGFLETIRGFMFAQETLNPYILKSNESDDNRGLDDFLFLKFQFPVFLLGEHQL